ncbi:hypothetical protein QIS74_12702 [Colletotrichum tabaci]|uniref:Uncharacterized protein n=1 Tax=Colletotrichum tabaci TaxID=1209068 RepID=A0AAV9SUA3_9PEZI
MAPQQNTFAVIPAAPGRVGGAPSKPPMTSKQAQKLYKQANKEPRRSKAEQRKWEKERQEEIRKELEKERAAVKARAARERKKAKEEEARENRRRAGEPIFDCRPSQDTIARFVRGNGTSLKRDSSGEPVLKNQGIPATSPDTKPTSLPSPMAPRTPPSVLPPNAVSLEGHKAPAISIMRSPGPSQGSKTSALPPQVPSHLSKQPSFEGMPPPPKLPSRDDFCGFHFHGASTPATAKVETKIEAVHDASRARTSSSATSAQDFQAQSPLRISLSVIGDATAAEVTVVQGTATEAFTADAYTSSCITGTVTKASDRETSAGGIYSADDNPTNANSRKIPTRTLNLRSSQTKCKMDWRSKPKQPNIKA